MSRCSGPKTVAYEISVFILLSLFEFHGMAQTAREITTPRSAYPAATIPNTEVRTLRSTILNQDMNIFLKLPVTYYADTAQTYPAWYFTDANRSFPMVANIASLFEIPRPDSPQVVIVGIGYQIRDMADWGAWRTRDLTPTNNPKIDKNWKNLLASISGRTYEVRSGGASIFLEFIIKELIPFVERNYRVSRTERGLGGYSYGGLFTLFSLFNHPEAFNWYFAGSPSLEYDNGILFQQETDFAAKHTNLDARVFMSVGGKEGSATIENMKKMTDRLRSRKYGGLKLETNIFPDEDHRSCYPSAIMRAFRVLLSK